MRVAAAVWLLLATGCDRVFDLIGDEHIDGGRDGSPPSDGAIRCEPWGSPVTLGPNGPTDPTLSSDGLELYLAVNAGTGYDVFETSRTDVNAAFLLPPLPVAAINAMSVNDSDPNLSGDNNRIVFKSARSGVERVYSSERGSRADSWQTPTVLTPVTTTIAGGIDLSPDGNTLYAATGLGPTDSLLQLGLADGMVVSTRSAGVGIRFPSVSADGLTVYTHDADYNLYSLTRASTTDVFEPSTRTQILGTASDPDISPDNQTLVYQDRAAGIAVLRRTCDQ